MDSKYFDYESPEGEMTHLSPALPFIVYRDIVHSVPLRLVTGNEVAASLAMNQTKVVKPLPSNPQTNSYSHLIYII